MRQQLFFRENSPGCPIHRCYRTSIEANVQRMSDSSVLSDNHRTERGPDVRFISVIGQPSNRKCSGCPIHQRYRTTIEPNVFRMSDSSALSDNHRTERTPDVRFIGIIGQPSNRTCSGCPIHRSYRTSFDPNIQSAMMRRGN